MANITHGNLPDHVYRYLRRRAEAHHRAVDEEIVACLEETEEREREAPQAMLERMDALRGPIKVKTPLTDELLRQALL